MWFEREKHEILTGNFMINHLTLGMLICRQTDKCPQSFYSGYCQDTLWFSAISGARFLNSSPICIQSITNYLRNPMSTGHILLHNVNRMPVFVACPFLQWSCLDMLGGLTYVVCCLSPNLSWLSYMFVAFVGWIPIAGWVPMFVGRIYRSDCYHTFHIVDKGTHYSSFT
jgi:hypothetical protein